MTEFLLQSDMVPFSAAFLLLLAFILLELISLFLGTSFLGDGGDGPDLDAELDADALDGVELEGVFDRDIEALESVDDAGQVAYSGSSGFLGWLGIGKVPIILWVAGVAASFGISGYTLQLVSKLAFGGLIPVGIAVAVALVPGLIGGRMIAGLLARIMPKTETSAVSRRHLGGRRGVISQGTASKDRPAECRVTDRNGAPQYIRVVPLDDRLEIAQGTDVIVLRPVDDIYPVIPFGTD